MFYYLVQDLKALVFSLISLHFKVRPPLAVDLSQIANTAIDQAYLGLFEKD